MKTEEESIERTVFSAFYLEIFRNKKNKKREKKKRKKQIKKCYE